MPPKLENKRYDGRVTSQVNDALRDLGQPAVKKSTTTQNLTFSQNPHRFVNLP